MGNPHSPCNGKPFCFLYIDALFYFCNIGRLPNCRLRWPTTFTSKPNAHSKLQIAHIKFKSLTANSNRSQQIQIPHSKFKSLTANYKSLTANYKSLTANSNRPQQIQIVHSKFKLLTANYKSLTALGVFGYLQPAVQLV